MAITPDGPLAPALKGFADAVRALADPQPLWVDGVCRWTPSTYARLRAALRGQPATGPRQVARSRLPCHTSVLALLIDCDMTVAEWQPTGQGTVERLHRLRDKSWRPQDCGLLEAHTAQLARWAVTAAELLRDRPPEVALRLPCPSCGRRFFYRQTNGESLRTWALRVSEDGARCQACDAAWLPERFEFLARLLGCPALPSA